MLFFYLSLIETDEDKKLFSEVYENYLDWMLRIAFHYTKNEQDSQDIVHDVFAEIIKSNTFLPSKTEKEIKSYLFICIRNRISKIIKKKNLQQNINFDLLFSLHSEENIEDKISNDDVVSSVQKFIDSMNPIYKDVLTLFFFYEKSIKEIAEILSAPIATVRTRLKRATDILKERFKEFDI
ncbi:MAG: sigma-70 family RNA polymerase sigma factor [Clostridia bacterium]|nr:sigma-70 family RNA polymerase sigma factor [Clostridia bacterium]